MHQFNRHGSYQESGRAFWGFVWLERLWQDVRYGARVLASNPGFTAVAVISLALGIGANCAIFSWADALLLRPLAVPRPGEVMTVGSTASVGMFSNLVNSYRDYVDIRDRSKSFDGLVGYTLTTAGFASQPDAPPKLRMGMLVSGNFFSVMGVAPDLGRGFRLDEDEVPGRNAVVILGHDFWQQQFASDASVLGRHVRINGVEFTVVGVMPSEFSGMGQFVRSDFYTPLMMWPRLMGDVKDKPLEARDVRGLSVKGRLKRGVTTTQAQAELTLIASDLERAYPDTNRNRTLLLRTELQARIAQDPPDAMLIAMLTTLALAVLFVACANVAGLLSSRAPARARELSLRQAIGAGRGRLIRQLITESVLIALGGGVLGIGVGYAGVSLFRKIQLPTDLPIVLSFQLDRRALVFSFLVSLASAVFFGLAPAIRTTRADLTAVMKASDAVSHDGKRRWGRMLLVGGQVAVSVVLLAMATFMYRGFQRQLVTGPGYRTDHLLMMSFDPSLVHYTQDETQRFFDQVAERARAVPGVKSATLSSAVPMSTDQISTASVVPEGFQLPKGQESVQLLASMVDDHYFDTMGMTVLKGRAFRVEDSATAPKVAIVNEQLAQHYWPGQNPLGKRFRMNDSRGPWVEIVGLAKNSKYLFLSEGPTDFVYLPHKQNPQPRMILLTESFGDPSALAAPLREVVRGLDVNQPIYNVRTMEEMYRMRTISIFSVLLQTVGSMGLMGLGLAIVGLYGLVAYAVSRRTKEIGIRMAIGAGRPDVLRMVLRQGVILAVAGLVVGLLGAVAAERALQAAFPAPSGQPNGLDTMALLLVAPAVLATTMLAAYIPARRASRLDPVKALRHE